MPFTKIWIHAVWGTKDRYPFLTKEVRSETISHIRQNARSKNIYIKSINGFTDHIHCLLALNTDTTIAKTLQLIKGESAFWINKHKLTPIKFEWACEYYAASISESHLPKVIAYIDNQEEHHSKTSFQDEYAQLINSLAIYESPKSIYTPSI